MRALKKEQEELLKDLKISESRSNQYCDQDSQEKLQALLEQKEELDNEIATEKQIIAELDKERKSWERNFQIRENK